MLIGTLAAALGVYSFDSATILPIMRRDVGAGVSLLSFMLATDIVDTFLCLLYGVAYTSFYFMVASPFGAFGEYLWLNSLYIHSMFGLGYLMSSMLPTNSAAISGSLLALIGGVCSGLAFQDNVPIWTFYFAEGLFRSEVQVVIDHAGDDLHYVADYAREVYGYSIGDHVIRDAGLTILACAGGFRFVAYLIFAVRLHLFPKRT